MSSYHLVLRAPAEGEESVHLDLLAMKKANLVLRALNHTLRQQILQFIAAREETCVSELYEQLFLDQSVASQHLAALRKAGVIISLRRGKFVFYRIAPDRIRTVSRALALLAG
jgi:DNA-binding transcriptional ArsR family regulator